MRLTSYSKALASLAVAVGILAPWATNARIFGATDATSRRLAALPPQAADRVARRDLLSTLQPADRFKLEPPGHRGWGNVESTTFTTWPYSTEYPYVCREDRITLGYRLGSRYSSSGAYVANSRRPEGIASQPTFHIEQLPVPDFMPGTSHQATICDAWHPSRRAAWIAAMNATEAVRAANLFRMAEDKDRAKTLAAGPCDRNGPDACRQWILSLDDPARITSVEPCAANHAGHAADPSNSLFAAL